MSENQFLIQIEEELEKLSELAHKKINDAKSNNELEDLRVSFLGKKGKVSTILRNMGKLKADQRPIIGEKANILKIGLQELIGQKKIKLKDIALEQRIKK